jgi:hypothetical protein
MGYDFAGGQTLAESAPAGISANPKEVYLADGGLTVCLVVLVEERFATRLAFFRPVLFTVVVLRNGRCVLGQDHPGLF